MNVGEASASPFSFLEFGRVARSTLLLCLMLKTEETRLRNLLAKQKALPWMPVETKMLARLQLKKAEEDAARPATGQTHTEAGKQN
jgi:hypothetical protein